MTTAPDPNPLLLTAIDVLRDTLPFIPALVGRDEATETTLDAALQTTVMLVQAIQAGLTREREIATAVLASLLAQDPLSLLGVVEMALETAQRRTRLADLTDIVGTPIPRVRVSLVVGEITYSLEDPA